MTGRLKIVSNGEPGGTKVFLPNGVEIAQYAFNVQVNMGGDEPAHVVLTYLLGELTVDQDVGGGQGTPDAVAEHRRRRMSGNG